MTIPIETTSSETRKSTPASSIGEISGLLQNLPGCDFRATAPEDSVEVQQMEKSFGEFANTGHEFAGPCRHIAGRSFQAVIRRFHHFPYFVHQQTDIRVFATHH